jgi:hypothetical protein
MAKAQEENQMDRRELDIEDRNALSPRYGAGFFEIRVKGHLNSRWSEWLEGLDVKLLDDGEMILAGLILDQAALIGVLNKLNRLNLTLLSVSKVDRNKNQ